MVAVSRDGGDEVVWTGNGLVDCTGERYGLLAQVKDPAEYTAMPGVVPGFVRVQPAPVAAGAGNGAVALYKEQKEDEYNTWELWSKRLRVTIFMGLGKTLQLEITDLVTRVVTMSNLEIMTHLRGLFAAPTATFIAELKANLKTPLQGSDLPSFIEHTSKFVQVVARLAAVNTVVNMDDQMLLFQETCQSQPAAADAIQDYIKLNPVHQNRNLQAMMVYLRLQLSNLTTAGAGFAGRATTTASSTASEQRIVQATIREMRRQGLVALHLPAPPAAAGGAAAPVPPRSFQLPPRPQNLYCYLHGYGSHNGNGCVRMKRLLNVQFTQPMLDAKVPTEVPGGHP